MRRDIKRLIEIGSINNELDYSRALIADRRLRLLAKENSEYKALRIKLRNMIVAYEKKEWNNCSIITDEKVIHSDICEIIAELERIASKTT